MNWTKIFDVLFRMLPRLAFVYPNEGGVFLRFGKYKRTLDAGCYFCLPIVDTVDKIPVTPQIVNLQNQSVVTSDGVSVAVSGAVEYSIRDVKKALLDVQDFDESLKNLAMGIIFSHVGKRSYRNLSENIESIHDKVLSGIRERANEWGLKVRRFYMTDFTTCQVLRLMGEGRETGPFPWMNPEE